MQYLPFVLIGVLVLLMAMPVYIRLSSKRMQGQSAPDYATLLAPEQQAMDKLLFYFYSEHCGPCRSLAPLIDRMGERFGNVVKVNVKYQADAARKFGIRATPTIVLVEHGKIIKVLLGAVSEKQLEVLLR
ncbi:MAG: thioredoxin family protein [Thiohalomonadaceae bacterium]